MSKPLYEEVIDEIGTQTLARVGLNIFSIDTFRGYGASVSGTNNIFYQSDKRKGVLTPDRTADDTDETYSQKLKNGVSSFRGYMYESIDENNQNISNALFGNGEKAYTSDTIADIRNVAGMIKDGKKYENLTDKEKAKFDNVKLNYDDELNSVLAGNDNFGDFKSQDTQTDLVTYDKNGKVIKKEQLKAIKNTERLLAIEKTPELDENGNKIKIIQKDKDGNIKKDKNGNVIYKTKMTNKLDKDNKPIYKYLGKDENGNEKDINLKVPFDDYKRHRQNLEEMIEKAKNNPADKKAQEKARAAEMALEKLNKSNLTNKFMCENPKTTAVVTQCGMAATHMVQAGLSDATAVAITTLANGVVYEIKDMFSQNPEKISIIDRIKRLIKKVMEKFKDTFKRGAGFGAIDAIVGIVTQFIKSVSGKIKALWKNLRESAKSIYKAIYSYITGEIKSYKDLTIVIIKALFSFTTILGSLGLESMIKEKLLFLGKFASIISPILAIVISAFVVVMGTKWIESSINYLFMLHASVLKSRAKRAEIEAIIDEFLPQLIEDNENLKNLIDTKFKEMKLSLSTSFADLQNAINSSNSALFISSLVGINSVYGMKLKYLNFSEFNSAMLSDKPIKI